MKVPTSAEAFRLSYQNREIDAAFLRVMKKCTEAILKATEFGQFQCIVFLTSRDLNFEDSKSIILKRMTQEGYECEFDEFGRCLKLNWVQSLES